MLNRVLCLGLSSFDRSLIHSLTHSLIRVVVPPSSGSSSSSPLLLGRSHALRLLTMLFKTPSGLVLVLAAAALLMSGAQAAPTLIPFPCPLPVCAAPPEGCTYVPFGGVGPDGCPLYPCGKLKCPCEPCPVPFPFCLYPKSITTEFGCPVCIPIVSWLGEEQVEGERA